MRRDSASPSRPAPHSCSCTHHQHSSHPTAVITFAQIRLLDELMNIEASKGVLNAASANGDLDVDRCYAGLGIKLDPVPRTADVHRTITEYVAMTHSSQHSAFGLEVMTVFEVESASQV